MTTTRPANSINYRHIALFALPLALSGIAMTGESPVVNAGVSRLADPEIGLAAFGVAMSVAWLIESPVSMMLDASTARAVDRRSFSIIRRYALLWCAMLTTIGALVGVHAAFQHCLPEVAGRES